MAFSAGRTFLKRWSTIRKISWCRWTAPGSSRWLKHTKYEGKFIWIVYFMFPRLLTLAWCIWFERFNWAFQATHWWRPTNVTSTLLKFLERWRICVIDCVSFAVRKSTLSSPNRISSTWGFMPTIQPCGQLLKLSSPPSLSIGKPKVSPFPYRK